MTIRRPITALLALALSGCPEAAPGEAKAPSRPAEAPKIIVLRVAPSKLERGTTEHLILTGIATAKTAFAIPSVTTVGAQIDAVALSVVDLSYTLEMDVTIGAGAPDSLVLGVDTNGLAPGAASETRVEVIDPPVVQAIAPASLTIVDGNAESISVILDHSARHPVQVNVLNLFQSFLQTPGSFTIPAGETTGQMQVTALGPSLPFAIQLATGGATRPLPVNVVASAAVLSSAGPTTGERGDTVQITARGRTTSPKGLAPPGRVEISPFSGLVARNLVILRTPDESASEFEATFDLEIADDASTEPQSITVDANGAAPGGTGSFIFTTTRGPIPLAFAPAAPLEIDEGGSTELTVILSGPATGQERVRLASSSPRVRVPAALLVPSGQTSGHFTVDGLSEVVGAKVFATLHGVTISTTVDVNQPIPPSIVLDAGTEGVFPPSAEIGAQFTLTLRGAADSPAAFGGAVVLSSPDGQASGVSLSTDGLRFTVTATVVVSALGSVAFSLDTNGAAPGAVTTFSIQGTPPVEHGPVIVTEFAQGADEFLEIHNPSPSAVVMTGWTLSDGTQSFPLVSTVGSGFSINPGESLFGVPSSISRAGAAFTWDSSLRLSTAKGTIELGRSDGALSDRVDYRGAATDGASEPAAAQFVFRAGASLQLDPGAAQDFTANNDGGNWCTSFQRADTAGAANGSCEAVVLNEVMGDYLGESSTDFQRVFIELAGPGGGWVSRWDVLKIREATTDGVISTATPSDSASYSGIKISIAAGRRLPVDGLFLIVDATSSGATQTCPANDIYTCAKEPNLKARFDPVNSTGRGWQLVGADATSQLVLRDALGWGKVPPGKLDTTEALAIVEGLPVQTGAKETGLQPNHSLSRDPISADTGDNRADFHWDPTPTPGGANDLVSPQITGLSVDNIPADAVSETSVVITGSDLALNSTFVFADTYTDFNDLGGAIPCTFRYSDRVTCKVKGSGIPGRGPVRVRAPAYMKYKGDPYPEGMKTDGWTFTRSFADGEPGGAEYCAMMDMSTAPSLNTGVDVPTGPIRAQIYKVGYTDTAAGGPAAGIEAEIGLLGPVAAGAPRVEESPFTNADWRFFPAAVTTRSPYDYALNNDEYEATLSSSAAATLRFVFRFTTDGGLSYTYCDANDALGFDTASLGTLTVQ